MGHSDEWTFADYFKMCIRDRLWDVRNLLRQRFVRQVRLRC